MKLLGQIIESRGSNKKYWQLDDLDRLYSLLQKKSMGELSKDLNIPYNSIRHRVVTYFPEDWIKKIKKQRKFHTKKPK